MKKIIPAILTDSTSDFEEKLEVLRTFSDWVQIDVMDGMFVNNLSVSLNEIDQFLISKKNFSTLQLEIHLMVNNAADYLEICQKIGAKRVIIHFESSSNVVSILEKMDSYNFEKGLAINPGTGVDEISDYLDRIDSVLLLSVTPGFQGQQFDSQVVNKIGQIKKIRPDVVVGMDGGINLETIEKVTGTKIDYAVVGSGIWKADDKKKTYLELVEKINL